MPKIIPPDDTVIYLEFDDNHALQTLCGDNDKHLNHIEKLLKLELSLRGNVLAIKGSQQAVNIGRSTLTLLYEKVKMGIALDTQEIASVIHLTRDSQSPDNDKNSHSSDQEPVSIYTKKRTILPRSALQADYIKSLKKTDLTLSIGPAGTGKTYIAVAAAVSALLSGNVERVILSRPAVEAGEKIGFLPGDMKTKIDPYLRPLYDALYDMMPAEDIDRRIMNGEIEIAPLAFMRGRTLSNAFVILDEAQNCTSMQMKMFLTRFGENSRMVIAGDMTQIDLPKDTKSGLKDALPIIEKVTRANIITFNEMDVVRHPLVSEIVKAYDSRDKA